MNGQHACSAWHPRWWFNPTRLRTTLRAFSGLHKVIATAGDRSHTECRIASGGRRWFRGAWGLIRAGGDVISSRLTVAGSTDGWSSSASTFVVPSIDQMASRKLRGHRSTRPVPIKIDVRGAPDASRAQLLAGRGVFPFHSAWLGLLGATGYRWPIRRICGTLIHHISSLSALSRSCAGQAWPSFDQAGRWRPPCPSKPFQEDHSLADTSASTHDVNTWIGRVHSSAPIPIDTGIVCSPHSDIPVFGKAPVFRYFRYFRQE